MTNGIVGGPSAGQQSFQERQAIIMKGGHNPQKQRVEIANKQAKLYKQLGEGGPNTDIETQLKELNNQDKKLENAIFERSVMGQTIQDSFKQLQ